MPIFLIGAVGGALATYFVSDKAASVVKWAAIGGLAYVGYQVLVKK